MASILADFVGNISAEAMDESGPIEGRVVLGKGQLVLASSDDERVTIPLKRVFDVNVGETPTIFDPMPGTPVTIAYRNDNGRVAAVVSTDADTIEKFVTVLFKALMNGTHTTIQHPAKVGGRVVDSEYRAGILTLQAEGVQFDTEEGPVSIALDSVIDFERTNRTVDGEPRTVLAVRHMETGTAMTTLVTTESNRKLSILGRYMQRTYQRLLGSLQQLSLSEPETETLATIYSAGDMDVSLASVLSAEPKSVKRILHSLHEKGLIESGDNGPMLTAKGQIVVNHHLERVNT